MFSYRRTSLEPGLTEAGLALESIVMGLVSGFWIHRGQPGPETSGVSLASESTEPPESGGAMVESGLRLKKHRESLELRTPRAVRAT